MNFVMSPAVQVSVNEHNKSPVCLLVWIYGERHLHDGVGCFRDRHRE